MKSIVIPFSFDEQKESDRQRAVGLHLSDVIKYMITKLDQRRYGQSGEDIDSRRGLFESGLIWEQMAHTWAARRATQSLVKGRRLSLLLQEPLQLDGILMTPDTIDLTMRLVREFKFTYISSKNDILSDRFFHWHIQIMAYVYVLWLQWEFRRRAEIYVMHVMSDWSRGKGPNAIPKAWTLQFSQQELVANWKMVLDHRDLLLSERRRNPNSKERKHGHGH